MEYQDAKEESEKAFDANVQETEPSHPSVGKFSQESVQCRDKKRGGLHKKTGLKGRFFLSLISVADYFFFGI
jgi:hypothetical protein